jgi:hypothetical protein
MLGDFNCTEYPTTDRHAESNANEAGAQQLRLFTMKNKLEDCVQSVEKITIKPTRITNTSWSRIDRIYISKNQLKYPKSIQTIRIFEQDKRASDHDALMLTFKTTKDSINYNTPWRMNPQNISETLRNLPVNPNFMALHNWWQNRKENIQTTAKKHSQSKASKNFRLFRRTIRKHMKIVSVPSQSPERLKLANDAIKQAWDELSTSQKLRAKYRWRHLGETSSRYNFMKIKQPEIKQQITGLKKSHDDSSHSDWTSMASIGTDFYQNLFKEEPTDQSARETVLEP